MGRRPRSVRDKVVSIQLFYNPDYSIYERQNSGFTGILNLLNESHADELFHTIVNLSYELCNNLKHSILYRKEYPIGHNAYLSSIYSYKIKKTDFKFLSTSPSGIGLLGPLGDNLLGITSREFQILVINWLEPETCL